MALFPTALAGIGGHLATLGVSDPTKKRRWLWAIWSLAGFGVIFAGLQQVEAYHSDTMHDDKIGALQGTLNTSLQRQEYMRGQLETIAATIGKASERSSDPAIGQLAQTISKMAGGISTVPAPRNAHVSLLYNNMPFSDGAVIKNASTGNPNYVTFQSFQVRVSGNSTPLSVRLYFSVPGQTAGLWQKTPSDESGFPTELWEGSQWPVSPQETWSTTEGGIQPQGAYNFPISAKVKVFFGADKPLEINFTIVK